MLEDGVTPAGSQHLQLAVRRPQLPLPAGEQRPLQQLARQSRRMLEDERKMLVSQGQKLNSDYISSTYILVHMYVHNLDRRSKETTIQSSPMIDTQGPLKCTYVFSTCQETDLRSDRQLDRERESGRATSMNPAA